MILPKGKLQCNIGIFVPNVNAGGTEKVAQILANHFACFTSGQITIISMSQNEFPFDTNVEKISIDYLPIKGKFRRFYIRLKSLNKIIQSRKIDIILSMGEYPNFLTALSSGATKKVIRLTNSSTSLSGFKGQLLRYSGALSYRFCDRMVVPATSLAREQNLSDTSNKVLVIPNPIVINEPNYSVVDKVLYPYFIHVGQMVKQKDHETLFRAFHHYVTLGGKCKLLLIGEGDLKEELKQLSKKLGLDADIKFMNWVEEPQSYIAAAKALILTSRWEGFPNVMLEAMALSKPIISTDCPTGPAEILKNGKIGCLIEPGDFTSIGSAMYKLDLDKEFNLELGQQSKRRSNDFNIDTIGNMYIEMFNEILKER